MINPAAFYGSSSKKEDSQPPDEGAGPSGLENKKRSSSRFTETSRKSQKNSNPRSEDDLSSGDESAVDPYEDSGSDYLPDTDDSLSDVENLDEFEDNDDEPNKNTTNDDDQMDTNEDGECDYSDIHILWGDDEFIPKKHPFDNTSSGLKNEFLTENSEEVDFFLNLLPEDIVSHIVQETNRYASQNHTQNWKDIDLNDMYVFLALTMLMARNKKLAIKEYWSLNPLLSSPIFRKTMSRDRYLGILSSLHFANNEDQSTTRLYKVENVLNLMKERVRSQFYPFEWLAVDESMVLFKGRLSFKQYIKTKRHRFGVKLYVLCDCETGIVLDFIVYIGKDTNAYVEELKGMGSSGSIVGTLLKSYLDYGHSLYTDNYYSSPILSNYLFDRKTNSCGTVRLTRKHMPKLSKNINRGDVSWKSSEKMLVIRWKDRRDVTMISTMHENKMVSLEKKDRTTGEPVKKPLCIVNYNERMGAIDRADMMLSSLECMRKSLKWYKKIFFHTIDLLLLNSHAMFLLKRSDKVPFAKFQLAVIQQLLDRFVLVWHPTGILCTFYFLDTILSAQEMLDANHWEIKD
uniref:PiggyBac transposable element-derived protein domain-containing protein n=1 Tax=Photinus pyralis TaxID=7054 RepID=A0A1Y1N5A9_PHOPY